MKRFHKNFSRHFSFMLLIFLAFFALGANSVFAQSREPKIGYAYPAGGQQGTTFEVLIGGRQISRPTGVVISGNGVSGKIIRGFSSLRINGADANKVAWQLYKSACKEVELDEILQTITPKNEEILLPADVMKNYLYFDRLANPTADDLQLIYYEHFAPRGDKNPKEAIAQGVLIEITISADATSGDRELRLLTPQGLTSPILFVVGTIPEINELEPNDFDGSPHELHEALGQGNARFGMAPKTIRQLAPQNTPILFNGQIRNGDVDRFSFHAQAKQKLVIAVQARHLIPFLADAVPGWFQAVITLYSSENEKISAATAYLFAPDPLILFDVPRDGVYHLEIQDSIFRGRDDFVYRISIDESPVIILKTVENSCLENPAAQRGCDIVEGEASSPTRLGLTSLFPLTQPTHYALDSLDEILEFEPNNSLQTAQKVSLPLIVNGQIDAEEDVDYFSFVAKKGETIVLDVTARVLNSPLDASLVLFDSAGKIIAENDDRAVKLNVGLQTHNADPYLLIEIPADGIYTAKLFSVCKPTGKEFAYRLRISAPRGDFSVLVEPSTLNFVSVTQTIKFHLIRHDGFAGEVQIRLADNLSVFRLDGAKIVAEENQITATLTLLNHRNFNQPIPLAFEAVAEIDGQKIIHRAIPVDDQEQAFIYHHLVPRESLLAIAIKRMLQGNETRRVTVRTPDAK